jgi:hypothetical protein
MSGGIGRRSATIESPDKRRPGPERHGIGDIYPMLEVEPTESCFWLDCERLALPITYIDGIWLRLCDWHAKAVHYALAEGLAIERRWQGDVHPIVWVGAREDGSTPPRS